MFDLFVFDLDGVLWDSNDAHVNVCKKALYKAGIKQNFDVKDITSFFGQPYKEVLKALLGDLYTPEKLELAYDEQQRLIYDDGFFDHVHKITGVESILSDLKKRDVKLAVASGNQRRFLIKALDFLDISGFFDIVLSADDVKNSKPDPEMLIKAMEFCNTKPKDTVFIGDARNDVLAAKSANTISTVVLTGALNLYEAEELNPDFIVESVLDLDVLF